ncbi:MAG: ABC transporter permease [Desulfobacterales bacterium]|jgi:peptide/nickel transport system permease protein
MLAYFIRRTLQFIPTIIGVTLIIFLLLNVLPGNAALMAGGRKELTAQAIEELKEKWGLHHPIHVRYAKYMIGLVKGDMGVSYLRDEPVSDVIAARIWPTLRLSMYAMIIAVGIGIPLGFYSAVKQGSWLDSLSMVGAVSGVSFPQFWLGLLLMYFLCVKAKIFPVNGYGEGAFINIVLPAITLGLGYMALLARTTRAAVLEILTEDYIRTARSKGISEFLIYNKHVLRNAMILILTTAGLQFGSMIGQTVVIEKLFSWPGIGSLVVDSIFQRDTPITQGCIIIIIFVFLVVNLLVDLTYSVIDPRIKYQ